LWFGVELVAKEEFELRVIDEGIDRGFDDGTGKDVYHGRHGFLCSCTQTHRWRFGVADQRCVFIQGDHSGACSIWQQFRLQGVNNKQQRQRDRDGLGEQEPVFSHVMMSSIAGIDRGIVYVA
jgi:hypothetical protein